MGNWSLVFIYVLQHIAKLFLCFTLNVHSVCLVSDESELMYEDVYICNFSWVYILTLVAGTIVSNMAPFLLNGIIKVKLEHRHGWNLSSDRSLQYQSRIIFIQILYLNHHIFCRNICQFDINDGSIGEINFDSALWPRLRQLLLNTNMQYTRWTSGRGGMSATNWIATDWTDSYWLPWG